MPITPSPYFARISIEEPATFISIRGDYPVESTMGFDKVEVQVSLQETVIVEIPAVQGPTGAASTMPGPVGPGFLFRGPYGATTLYVTRDVVSYQGSSWVLVAGSALNSTPSLSSLDWNLFSSKGDKGDTGSTGVGANTPYVYMQDNASKVWNINHNLNRFPSVSIVDSENRINHGDVVYVDANNITISFQMVFTGKAYLN